MNNIVYIRVKYLALPVIALTGPAGLKVERVTKLYKGGRQKGYRTENDKNNSAEKQAFVLAISNQYKIIAASI